MTSHPGRGYRMVAEAVTAGLAYAMLLWWLSVCALGSFRPGLLPFPYWPDLGWLRSDTSGTLAFAVTAVCLVSSEYLRLRRRAVGRAVVGRLLADRPVALLTVAVAEMVAVLSTGLVGYISTNAITHPETLLMRTTHLAPWPTEGTLRMLALVGCAASVAVLRYLLAGSPLVRPWRRLVAASFTGVPGEPSRDEVAGDGFAAVSPGSPCPRAAGR